jgi:hypothetical protein
MILKKVTTSFKKQQDSNKRSSDMRGLLAAAALLAFLPTAHAQDKAKSDFSAGGEFRVRDTWEMNESGNKSTKPASHNGIDQRFKLGLKFKADEKLTFHGSLLQAAAWGQGGQDNTVGDRGTANNAAGTDEKNFMSVNEAYATWMMSEDFHANVGRMNYSFGDGSVMSVNDWQAQPFAFDGLTLNYEAEFGKFTLFGFKYRDYSFNNAITNANSTTSDPQHDAYGLVFDLKTMPEWLKSVNAHIIDDTGDTQTWGAASTNSVSTLGNVSALRYGVGAGFGFMGFELKADAEMVTGKASATTANGAVADPNQHSLAQSMYQAELAYSMPSLMGSRWYVGYHMDSGTSASDKTPTAASSKFNTYDGYFHDLHTGSGLMELVGWGNLTMIDVGWTVKPTDMTDVGLQYLMFTKTKNDDNVNPGMYGGNLFGATKSGEKNIGSEVDLWAEHKYSSAFSTIARLGYFMPGAALKDDTIKKGDSITQVFVQGKMTF